MSFRRSLRRLLIPLTAASLAVVALPAQPALAKSDFTDRPFMGWSSWSVQSSTHEGYGQNWLNEENVKRAADGVATHLASAGYEYVNMDAGWNATLEWDFHTDASGIPNADPARFPNGITEVIDYIHGKDLKAGLYAAAGLEKEVYEKNAPIEGAPGCFTGDIAVQPLTPTNMWGGNWKIDYDNPCAQEYINSIADRFASWGVDFVKIDGTTEENVADIAAWSEAIDQSGRTMWLTASAWPVPHAAAGPLRPHANSVRVDTDVECYCDTLSTWESSADNRWEDLPAWLGDVEPNYWPDLDTMPISNNTGQGIQDGLNDTERQSVMTFWSMASSPLYAGGDPANLDETAVSILTNPEVVAVNQAGRLPVQVEDGTLQQWVKEMPDGSLAVAVYNLGSEAADITVDFGDVGAERRQQVRDLAARADLGRAHRSWTAEDVPPHGSRIVQLTPAR